MGLSASRRLAFLAVLLTAFAHAQSPPQGWIEVDPPASERDWQCANFSSDSWHVRLEGSALRIRPSADERSPLVLTVAGGRFVGDNQGEFGGDVTWQPSGRQSIEVLRDNPVAFYRLEGAVFVVAGLAHLGTDGGRIVRLARDGERWQVSAKIDLGEAPYAMVPLGREKLAIVGTGGLIEADLRSMTARQLHRNERWGMVFPTSAVLSPSGAILIGMRRAVVKLAPVGAGYEEKWWVPQSCARLVPKDRFGPCECRT